MVVVVVVQGPGGPRGQHKFSFSFFFCLIRRLKSGGGEEDDDLLASLPPSP